MNKDLLIKEFERQVGILVAKEYPKLMGLDEKGFRKLLLPLQDKLIDLNLFEINFDEGKLPFVIVIPSSLVPTELAMSKVERLGKIGIIKLFPLSSSDFLPISSVTIPKIIPYLIVNIDRGRESLNVRPENALKEIVGQNRTGLTIDEGVAIVTVYPDFLMKNNCFSLVTSRHHGDQRVPAIWINGAKQPNLGWCWDRNPHTWLGTASCELRVV